MFKFQGITKEAKTETYEVEKKEPGWVGRHMGAYRAKRWSGAEGDEGWFHPGNIVTKPSYFLPILGKGLAGMAIGAGAGAGLGKLYSKTKRFIPGAKHVSKEEASLMTLAGGVGGAHVGSAVGQIKGDLDYSSPKGISMLRSHLSGGLLSPKLNEAAKRKYLHHKYIGGGYGAPKNA